MRIPIFDVDPTVVGPVDLAKRRYAEFVEWARQPLISVGLIGGAVGLVAVGWIVGVSMPSIPNWIRVALLAMIPGSLAASKWGGDLAEGIHDPDVVVLSELNTYSGDQRIIKVAPERFRETTVVNHHWDPGEEPMEEAIVGRERLHRVQINGKTAYEVDRYDPVLNVAVCSWQAGRTSVDIRQDHEQIRTIKTDMEDQIDTVYEILSRETQVIRQAVAQQTNKIVAMAQDSELPEEAEIGSHQTMSELFEDEGLNDDLLDDDVELGSEDMDDEIEDMTEIEVLDP